MSAAAPVISSVPTTAGPMPPPGSRSTNGRSLVRKFQLMTSEPLLDHVDHQEDQRDDRDQEGERDHRARDHVRGLAALRPPGRREVRGLDERRASCHCSRATVVPAHDRHGRGRRPPTVRTSSTTPMPISAARWMPIASPNWLAMMLARVSPGPNRCALMCCELPIEQGHGDGLADGATEPDHDRGDEATAAVREDRAADHLPPRRAHAVRGLLQRGRRGREDLTGERGDDRRDHDRHDDPGGHEAETGRARVGEEVCR